jgi:hypothetical protein
VDAVGLADDVGKAKANAHLRLLGCWHGHGRSPIGGVEKLC